MFVVDDFITEDERLLMKAAIEGWYRAGMLGDNGPSPNGAMGRHPAAIRPGDSWFTKSVVAPQVFNDVRARLMSTYNLSILDTHFGDFVTFMLPGTSLHHHIDPVPRGFVHVRPNILITKPKGGFESVINGVGHPVEERGMFAIVASRDIHGTGVHIGSPRMTVSYGFYVTCEKLEELGW